MTRGRAVAAAAVVLTIAAGILVVVDVPAVAIAVTSGLALGLVAWAIALGTDALRERFGPATTGVVQSTLGNLPWALHRRVRARRR
jgi:Ca2+:H+ antiporter